MVNRSDQGCLRGCLQEDVHYADCSTYDPAMAEQSRPCRGCAPVQMFQGTLLCEDCYKRMRRLLRDAGDLLGRLQSLTEHGKAAVYQAAKVPSSGIAPRDQVDADLLDAIGSVTAIIQRWSWSIDIWGRTLKGLDGRLNDVDATLELSADVLDAHAAVDHGWSLADASARWGVERRDRHRHVYPVEGVSLRDGVIERLPVQEWHDPLLTTRQAAHRVGKSQRAVQKWIADGVLDVAVRVRLPDGTVIRSVYASAVDAVALRMRPGRPRGVKVDTPGST